MQNCICLQFIDIDPVCETHTFLASTQHKSLNSKIMRKPPSCSSGFLSGSSWMFVILNSATRQRHYQESYFSFLIKRWSVRVSALCVRSHPGWENGWGQWMSWSKDIISLDRMCEKNAGTWSRQNRCENRVVVHNAWLIRKKKLLKNTTVSFESLNTHPL